jgi:hypothetical protein
LKARVQSVALKMYYIGKGMQTVMIQSGYNERQVAGRAHLLRRKLL